MKINRSTFKLRYLLLLAAMMAIGVANATLSSATPAVIGHLPEASNITIAPKAPKAGETVTVTWDYHDTDGDVQSGTFIEWLLAGSLVSGGASDSFTLPNDAAGKNLQVRITPRSQAPADPVVGNPVTTAAVTIAANQTGTVNFTKPTTDIVNFKAADAYCKSLIPAARLPTSTELQNLFVSSTSATAIGQTNYDMCNIHSWPLGSGRCGGRSLYYWTNELDTSRGRLAVGMHNGVAYGLGDGSMNYFHVTCVR